MQVPAHFDVYVSFPLQNNFFADKLIKLLIPLSAL